MNMATNIGFFFKLTVIVVLFLFAAGTPVFAEEIPFEEEGEGEETEVTIENLGDKIKALNQERMRIRRDYAKEKTRLAREYGSLIMGLFMSNKAERKELDNERAALLETRDRLARAYKESERVLSERIKELIAEYLGQAK